MQNLRPEHSFELHVRALRFHNIRLSSRPDTRPYGEEIGALRELLKQKGEAYDQALEERIAANTEVDYRDGVLDESVYHFGRDLLAMVGGDRQDPRFKKVFPVSPAVMMKPVATQEQNRAVVVLLERLQEDEDLEPLRMHYETIFGALEDLKAAMEARDAKYIVESKAHTDRQQCLDTCRRAYRLQYPKLQLLFPDKPKLVESFFLQIAKKDEPPSE